MPIAKDAVVEIQWQYRNTGKDSHNERLGHGFLVNGKVEFTHCSPAMTS